MKLLKEMSNFDYTLEEDSSSGGNVIVSGILQRADTENQNGRVYPRNILEREIQNYKKLVDERRAIGECDHALVEGTEVLTKNGWKNIEDLYEGEQVYSLNTETNEIELNSIDKKIETNWNDDLYHIYNNRKIDMMVSPNHRILLWDRHNNPYYIKAKEFYDQWANKNSWLSHSYISSKGVWNDGDTTEQDEFQIPGTEYSMPMKTWAAFLGLWIAEGFYAVSKGGSSKNKEVSVCQSDNGYIDKIHSLLEETNLPWAKFTQENTKPNGKTKHIWSIFDKNIHAYFSQFGNLYEKYLPREVFNWNQELLSTLLEWMLIGDEYATTSKQLADDVSHVMFLLGAGSYITKRSPESQASSINGREVLVENCQPLYNVCEEKSDHYTDCRFVNVDKTPYKGMIYCLSVKNRNFMARYNGKMFWTGNSDDPVVNLKNASHVVTDIWMEDNEVKGKIEVLPTPSGDIIKKLLESNIKIGISSRALGSVQSRGDLDYVQDDLYFICFDFVSEPSTNEAWMVKEAKEINPNIMNQILNRSDRIYRSVNDVLEYHNNLKST